MHLWFSEMQWIEYRIDIMTLTCDLNIVSAFIEHSLRVCDYPVDSAIDQTISGTGVDSEHDNSALCRNVLSRKCIIYSIAKALRPFSWTWSVSVGRNSGFRDSYCGAYIWSLGQLKENSSMTSSGWCVCHDTFSEDFYTEIFTQLELPSFSSMAVRQQHVLAMAIQGQTAKVVGVGKGPSATGK